MICSIRTLGITGIRGCSVVAECYISNGLPGFDIVGLPDAAVKEARSTTLMRKLLLREIKFSKRQAVVTIFNSTRLTPFTQARSSRA